MKEKLNLFDPILKPGAALNFTGIFFRQFVIFEVSSCYLSFFFAVHVNVLFFDENFKFLSLIFYNLGR